VPPVLLLVVVGLLTISWLRRCVHRGGDAAVIVVAIDVGDVVVDVGIFDVGVVVAVILLVFIVVNDGGNVCVTSRCVMLMLLMSV